MDGGRLVMLQVAEEQAGGWELPVQRFRFVLHCWVAQARLVGTPSLSFQPAWLCSSLLCFCLAPRRRSAGGDSEIRARISKGRWLWLGWLVTGLRPFMAGCLPFRRYGPAAFVAERRESETNRAWSLNTRAWSMEPRVRDHSVVYGTEQCRKYYCNGIT